LRPWFRGAHTRPGHPSIVSGTARSRPWDFPESPSPHPSGCDPAEACACGLGQSTSPWLEGASMTRAPLSLDLVCRPARQPRCERFFRARSRVSEVRLVAPAGVATGDASDRLLHSETVPTRALVPRRFPAQQPSPRDAFRRSPEGCSRSRASRLRARPRERLFSRAAPPVRRRAKRAPGSSGPPDANEAGADRASRRDPHFGARTIVTRWRSLPAA
jgi:hypothetical protein